MGEINRLDHPSAAMAVETGEWTLGQEHYPNHTQEFTAACPECGIFFTYKAPCGALEDAAGILNTAVRTHHIETGHGPCISENDTGEGKYDGPSYPN